MTMNSGPGTYSTFWTCSRIFSIPPRSDNERRYAQTVGLGAHRVDLAVHFLEQEVELAPARFRAVGERGPVRHVAAERATSSLMSERAAMRTISCATAVSSA